MAGVLVHLAMGDPEKTDPSHSAYSVSFKKAYTLGLLLPDLAKRGFFSEADDFGWLFEGCSPTDRLTYEEYLSFQKNNHFNPSRQNPARQDTRNPNLADFVKAGYVDLHKPVWQGVLCHLMGDKAFYHHKSCCVDFERLRKDYAREVGEIIQWEEKKWENSRTGKVYYNDYNLLNQCVEDQYGVLEKAEQIVSAPLLDKILTGFKVRFSDSSAEPVYMNWENIRNCIEHLRFINQTIFS